jgi:hypothetical protein
VASVQVGKILLLIVSFIKYKPCLLKEIWKVDFLNTIQLDFSDNRNNRVYSPGHCIVWVYIAFALFIIYTSLIFEANMNRTLEIIFLNE